MLGQLRRYFSVLFVKSQSACLAARLGHLGDGAMQVAGIRGDLMVQEQSARKEAEAFFSAYVRGRGGRSRMGGPGVRGVRRGPGGGI